MQNELVKMLRVIPCTSIQNQPKQQRQEVWKWKDIEKILSQASKQTHNIKTNIWRQ